MNALLKSLAIATITAFVLPLASCATSQQPIKVGKAVSRQLNVRTTAYTHSEKDHKPFGAKTAIGTKLKHESQYTSAACDWSWLPVGTVFEMAQSNIRYVVDDYGSALVGTHTIDIYTPTKTKMKQWGVRHVDISIIHLGDYQYAKSLLQKSKRPPPHIKQMLADIQIHSPTHL